MRKFFLLIFLLFLLFPLISAVEFNLRENFQEGETIITKISGNFLTPITGENVFFYRGHVRIPVDYGIAKIDNDYYIYSLLSGKEPGNYSISIENIQYMKGAEVIKGNLVRNFSIINETADFSLKPGVVVASGDFFVEVQNLQDRQIIINVKAPTSNNSERDILFFENGVTSKEASVSVKSGEIKKIYFRLGNGNPSLQTIELKTENLTYELPVYILTALEQMPVFRLEPSELVSSIPTKSITKKTIYLYNTGDSEMRNISLSLSDEIKPFVNLSQYYINKLEAKSNAPIELLLFSPGEIEVDGNLKANLNGEKMLYSQISLKFLDNYILVNESKQSYITMNCADIPGIVCSSSEKCSQEIAYAKDNVCCLGKCESAKKNSTGTIIAIIILAVIIFALIWFYRKKYKKAKRPVDLLKIAKKK